MKTSTFAAVTGAFAASAVASPSLATRATTVTPITIKGNAFFQGDKRFYIRGVDYQPGGDSDPVDPIADADSCKRDIVKFKSLGLNTVRVYTVDNSVNHDDCMNALAEAGIYLALDVNSPKYSINRAEPEISYNAVYLQNVFATIDAFSKYSNTLLFFSGNEVINDDATTSCAPYVKATTRDMKSYINSRGYRSIPVGYSAADVDSNRFEMAQYMNCGPDAIRSDFFAFNDYAWCDPSSYQVSGWDQKVAKFNNYSIPLFLSEYGCNLKTRKFEEVKSLYSTDMTGVYSGGLVYEYSEEGTKFGLVTISGNSVTEGADFATLKSALAGTVSPSGDGGYKSSGSASECPNESKTWNVTIAADQLPKFPSDASDYLKNGAGDGAGLKGAGSQNSGSKITDLAPAASGAVVSGASASKTGAASALRPGEFSFAPVICGMVVLVSTFFGGALML